MKRTIALALLGIAACASLSVAQISGSHHDLSTGGGIVDKSTNESQKCIFCHTPHQTGMTAIPLWNHTLASTATYGTYTGLDMQSTPAEIGGGSAVSNLCMSCHDGTVAVNSLGNKSTLGTPTMGSGNELNASFQIAAGREANMGTSLSNDHPINFTYNAALATADGELVTPVSATSVDAAGHLKLFPGTGSLVSTVQCATCHDVHKTTNPPFLTLSNSGSALCLSCHQK